MANPQRITTVLTQVVGEGLAVRDSQRNQSHVLNATAALVFQNCDGRTTPQQLTDLVRAKFNLTRGQAEQLMWLALDELEKANLLQDKVSTTQPPRPATLTRRHVLTGLAAAGLSLMLMPIVSGMKVARAVEPTPPPTTPPTTPPPTVPPTTPPPTPPPSFPFTGFIQPVDNPPTVNRVNAGQAIPVKFKLGGYRGMNIFATGYPQSVRVNCDGYAPIDDILETTSKSGLSYDAASDQYTYVWKTEKSWAGTCRQFIMILSDGTTHVANFKFK